MERMREQFEAWWEINYHNGNPPRFGWAAWRDDDGYKIDDDESELDGMWEAWQASREAIEIELQQFDHFQICHYGADEKYADGYIDAQNNANKAIDAAGIKVKQ